LLAVEQLEYLEQVALQVEQVLLLIMEQQAVQMAQQELFH
jgi:hypothetical protein